MNSPERLLMNSPERLSIKPWAWEKLGAQLSKFWQRMLIGCSLDLLDVV